MTDPIGDQFHLLLDDEWDVESGDDALASCGLAALAH
jgi:hypothetical protein